ncbi:MAG: hypothetical protein IKP45_04015 [Bacteroidales bacterium]|nr:hypothetical protein [Bacteroidales bacterium]
MFDENLINKVWDSAKIEAGYSPDRFRKDACGAWIIRNQYGRSDTIYGWEIDHIYPQALGGKDDLFNLRAMQWENNRSKGDDYPVYKAVVRAEGNKNVYENSQFTVNEDKQRLLSNIYSISKK